MCVWEEGRRRRRIGPIIAFAKMAFAKPDEVKNEIYGRDDRPIPVWREIILKRGVDFFPLFVNQGPVSEAKKL